MIDNKTFRQLLGHFASGVTVVTTEDSEGIHGITVSAFLSVSMNPPLILVSIDKRAKMHPRIPAVGRFAVSLLSADQAPYSNHFAGYSPEGLEVRFVRDGAQTPYLDGALAWLDCTLHQTVESGDHTLYIGQIEAGASKDGLPLLYWRGKYGGFTPA